MIQEKGIAEASVPTPGTGFITIFLSLETGTLRQKDSSGTVSPAGGPNMFETTFTGDGATLVFAVNHNLNTRHVHVQVVEGFGSYNRVNVSWAATTVNQVTFSFGSAPSGLHLVTILANKQP